jgi:molybdopterin-guanine dinucleotide biosynthesis protein A
MPRGRESEGLYLSSASEALNRACPRRHKPHGRECAMKTGTNSDADVRGYVLSGGASSRFGRDKALVGLGETPLLLQIVELAQTCTADVTVVAGAQKYSELGGEFQIIEDGWPGEGPLGGVITALEHTAANHPECRWNLILSCDMPFLTREWLQFLVDRATASAAETQVILAHSAHGPEPLCACYRTDAAGALKGVFDRGVRKVTEALKHVRTEVLDESAWKRFDSAGRLFWNMNTPEDFEEAQRLWKLGRAAG